VYLRILKPSVLLWLAALILAPACGAPCQTLANHICECRPNSSEVNACKQGVANAQPGNITQDQENVCSQLLNSCNCDQLLRIAVPMTSTIALEACGLAN
jgi:hypothetical protein